MSCRKGACQTPAHQAFLLPGPAPEKIEVEDCCRVPSRNKQACTMQQPVSSHWQISTQKGASGNKGMRTCTGNVRSRGDPTLATAAPPEMWARRRRAFRTGASARGLEPTCQNHNIRLLSPHFLSAVSELRACTNASMLLAASY